VELLGAGCRACCGNFLHWRFTTSGQWLLANLDEVALMNNLTLPIFSADTAPQPSSRLSR